MFIKVWVLIGWIVILPVNSLQKFKALTKHEENDQSASVVLRWRYSQNQSDVLKDVSVNFNGQKLGTCSLADSEPNCQTKNPTKYKLTLNSISNIIQFEIFNLSYDDRGVYDGMVTTTERHALEGILVKVRGPLSICGDHLKSSYKFGEGFTPTFDITVCGYPQPSLAVGQFNGDQIKNVSRISSDGDFKQTFSLQLSPLQPNSCGKKLYFKIQNEFNTAVISTIIYIDFWPPTVHNIKVEENEECIKVSWHLIKSGNCKLKYQVKTKRNHTSIGLYTTEPFVDKIQICVNKRKWRENDPITAQVRGVFFDKNGTWSRQVAASTLNGTSPSKTALIVGLVLGSVIFLLLLFILLFFYIKRERKKNSRKDYRPTKSSSMSKTDFIDVSLLNLKKSKSSPKTHYMDMSGATLRGNSQYTNVNEREACQPTYTKLNVDDKLYENMNELKPTQKIESEQSEYEIPSHMI